jgi:hypothetical protein
VLGTPLDIPELRIPIRVLLAFFGLGIRLQTIAQLVEQLSYQFMADGMALPSKGLGQLPGTLARPPERGHRIASTAGIDQPFQRSDQVAILLDLAFPSASRTTDTFDRERFATEVFHRLVDGGPGETAEAGDESNATTAQLLGIGSSHQMLLPFG